jgi:hypothetical protein
MGEHRTPASKAIIDALAMLGTAFGYHVEREWKLPNTGPHPEQVDIALFVNAQSLQPAFIIEVDSSDGAAATSNAVKVFGKQTTHLIKPFFLYHVFLQTAANGQRVGNLSALFDKINYKAYNFGANADRQNSVRDVIAHHAALRTSVDVEAFARALDDSVWDAVEPAGLLDALACGLGLGVLTLSTMARVSIQSQRFLDALSWIVRKPISDVSVGQLSFSGHMFTMPLWRGLRAYTARSAVAMAVEYESLRKWQSELEIIFNSERTMLGLSPEFDYAVTELAPPLFCLVAMLFGRYEKGAQELCRQLLTRATQSNLSPTWSRYASAWCVIASLRVGGDAVAIAERAIAEINRLGGLPLVALPFLTPPVYSEEEPSPWVQLMTQGNDVAITVDDFRSRLQSVPQDAESLTQLVAELLVSDDVLTNLNEGIVRAASLA